MVVDCLQLSFPAGYEGPLSTPAIANHPSATSHPCDLGVYIIKEVGEGAILGPFDQRPFTP